MKKVILFVITLLLALPFFAQDFDLAVGLGHTWDGSGNYLYGTDRRELNFQLETKTIFENGLGIYGGYTRDAVKYTEWLNRHNFTELETTNLKTIQAFDLGGMYMIRRERLDAWVAAGAAVYRSEGETGTGAFAAVGVDYQLAKKLPLFLGLKCEWRSHVTDFKPMQASAFETGLLLGWRF